MGKTTGKTAHKVLCHLTGENLPANIWLREGIWKGNSHQCTEVKRKCVSRMKEVTWQHTTRLDSVSVQLSHVQPVTQLSACSPHLGSDGHGPACTGSAAECPSHHARAGAQRCNLLLQRLCCRIRLTSRNSPLRERREPARPTGNYPPHGDDVCPGCSTMG